MADNDYKVCPYCGEEIKAKAIKCKHCHSFLDKQNVPANALRDNSYQTENKNGYTNTQSSVAQNVPLWKKWWVWTAAVLIVLIFIIASGGQEDAETTSPETFVNDQTTNIADEPVQEPEVEFSFINIGETTTFGGWKYKVIDVEVHDVIRNERPRGQYIVFMIEITNHANMDRKVGRLFGTFDQEGRVFSMDTSASLAHHHAYRTDAWYLEDIGPSFSAVIPVAFDIPLDVETIFLMPREIKEDDYKDTSIFTFFIE